MNDSIKMSANHIQVGGDHYKTQRPGQQEHWDIVATHGLDYFQGQVTKYVMRWKKKGGLQDLRKGLHFLQKYVELVEANVITDPAMGSQMNLKMKTAMDVNYDRDRDNPLRDGDQYLTQKGPPR